MNFDEIPCELKEYVFTYLTPNEWINTVKVSREWLQLTLRSIKKIESCDLLILDHLAEFINQQRETNYKWFSLLTLMPRLEHLECIENTEAFWTEISSNCHQLKLLNCKPREVVLFDCNKLDISFKNLVELLWDGAYQGPELLFRILELAPKVGTIKITNVEINAGWKNKIPKSVKHILLNKAFFYEHGLLNNLSEDTSALETFSAQQCWCFFGVSSELSDATPRLTKLELELTLGGSTTSMIVQKTRQNCQGLETVKVHNMFVNDSWRKLIPENVKSINFFDIYVQENICSDFSPDWFLKNYAYLQSLELTFASCTGFDSQKFYSTENLKKLVLDNSRCNESVNTFSDISLRMIRGSHLVYVEIHKLNIDEYWRHIFPPTIKRLILKDFRLSKEAELVFSPQFICENPTNLKSLILEKFDGDLPAMNLNAFSEMQGLQKLHLTDLRISGECLQSILTHCSADLFIWELTAGALTNIPHNLVLPSLRKLGVKEPVDESSLLLQHFTKLHTVDIAIVPPEASFLAILNALQVAETAELRIGDLSWDLLCCLVQSIDDTKYKYFCLSVVRDGWKEISFFWTNSLVDACCKIDDIIISGVNDDVLWINNYPSSPLISNVHRIP